MIVFTFASDIGKQRKNNEDVFGYFEDEFFIVADGMGGLPAGEVAAQLAVEEALETYQKTKSLKRAFNAANRKISLQSRKDLSYFGMGTTLVGAVVKGKKATIANVGDSRAYLVSDNEIAQITVDHGLGMGVVTRMLGLDGVEVDIFERNLKKGDLLLLCTDGLTNMVADEKILAILKNVGKTKKALEKKAEKLVVAANKAGGFDNITVGLIELV